MSEIHYSHPVPRSILIAFGALLLAILVFAGAARTTGIGATVSEPPATGDVATLYFEDRADGAVVIYTDDDTDEAHDSSGGQEGAAPRNAVDVLEPGSDAFVRSVVRGLVRERRARRLGDESGFLLRRSDSGRIALEDPATGRWIDLGAFGPANVGAFVRILDAAMERG